MEDQEVKVVIKSGAFHIFLNRNVSLSVKFQASVNADEWVSGLGVFDIEFDFCNCFVIYQVPVS